MPLDIRAIKAAEFDALAGEWNALLSQSRSDNVFLRWEWIHTWWNVFKQDRDLLILTAREGGRLVGVAPFYVQRAGPLGAKTLRLCSDDLSPDYLDLIAAQENETAVTQEFFTYLSTHRSLWDVLAFEHVRTDSILNRNSFLWNDYRPGAETAYVCPYIELTGTFEDYIQGRSQLTRFSLKKKQQKLFRDMGVSYQTVQTEAELSKALNDLFHLHDMRKKEKQIETAFTSPAMRQFHDQVGRLFLKAGILNLECLYDRQTPVCAHYYLNYKNKVYFYQSGFDPQWGKMSVSMVLLYLGLEKAFHEGRAEFDLLKGNQGYKLLWSNASRDEIRVTAYNKTLIGASEYVLRRLKTSVKTGISNSELSLHTVSRFVTGGRWQLSQSTSRE